MTPLERALVRKALNDNGFHAERPDQEGWIIGGATYASGACCVARFGEAAFAVAISRPDVAQALRTEGFSVAEVTLPALADGAFQAPTSAALNALIRRAYQLSAALPSAPWARFQAQTRDMPAITEAERVVVARVGQDLFREALLDYWDGACAVTGLDQAEMLRASHIKPWSACADTPHERLDVFNGLLLSADLDAAFDSGLVSFDSEGAIVLSPRLSNLAKARLLGLRLQDRTRIKPEHAAYLTWHKLQLFQHD